MIYLVVGITPDRIAGLLSSGTNLQYAMTAYNGIYTNYDKVIMYLINVSNQTLTVIAQK